MKELKTISQIEKLRLPIPKYFVSEYFIVTKGLHWCNIRSGLLHADGETKSPYFYSETIVSRKGWIKKSIEKFNEFLKEKLNTI